MPASANQELAADALLGSAQVAITQKAWEEVEQHLSKVCCLTYLEAEWHLPWLEPGLHCAYQWWLLHFAAQHKRRAVLHVELIKCCVLLIARQH